MPMMTQPRQPPPLTAAEVTTSTIHAGEDADTTTEPSTSTSPDIRETVGFASFGRHCGTKPDLGDDIPQPESRDLHVQTVVTPRAHDLPRSSLLDVSDDTTRELPTSRFPDTCFMRRRTGCLHAISCRGVGWQGMVTLSPLIRIELQDRVEHAIATNDDRPWPSTPLDVLLTDWQSPTPYVLLIAPVTSLQIFHRNVIRSQYHSG
ncbi:hypothetical protein F4604DRAFT_1683837 [Suillus subluteus]|nr:hypothetical protein F4604DRAFT_1683837 [Suillus subluteus]